MKHADCSVFSIAVAGWNSSGPLPLFGGFSVLRPLFCKSCVTVGQIRFDSIRLWTLSQNSKVSQSRPVMNSLRRCLKRCLNWVGARLQRCLVTLWATLPGVGKGRASLRDAKKGSCKADSREWRSNEALRKYLHGGVDETCVTVQSSTHEFNVSKH